MTTPAPQLVLLPDAPLAAHCVAVLDEVRWFKVRTTGNELAGLDVSIGGVSGSYWKRFRVPNSWHRGLGPVLDVLRHGHLDVLNALLVVHVLLRDLSDCTAFEYAIPRGHQVFGCPSVDAKVDAPLPVRVHLVPFVLVQEHLPHDHLRDSENLHVAPVPCDDLVGRSAVSVDLIPVEAVRCPHHHPLSQGVVVR